MSKHGRTGLVSIVSGLPLPVIPASITNDEEIYLRQLHQYLQRLSSAFNQDNVAGTIGYPDTPQDTRDYHLFYDSSEADAEWRIVNQSIQVDNDAEYVDVGTMTGLTAGNDLTFECWYRVASGFSTRRVLAGWTSGADFVQFIDEGNGVFSVWYDRSTVITKAVVSSAVSYDDKKWHHIVMCIDPGTGAKIYFDGAVQSVTSSTSNSTSSTAWSVFGASMYLGRMNGGTAYNAQGYLDEVAIYPDELTVAEIATHYSFGLNGSKEDYKTLILSHSPFAYWGLDETSGTIAYDDSGNSRNGTYSGVTLQQAGVL